MAAEKNKNMNMLHSGNMHFLYDPTLIDDVSDTALFEHEESLMLAAQLVKSTAQGRGEAVFFKYKDLSLVYKHYQRGGLVARILHDQYFGIKLETTRAFREWCLLRELQLLDLSSPVPVAARVIRSGLLYRADLVMREIENTATLADLCFKTAVEAETWFNVGQCIKRFHDHDVYHADLNARNILIGKDGMVYLLDFDKGCFRHSNDSWKASNLSRLNRSLVKFQSSDKPFHYKGNNWDQLLSGYSGG